MVASVRRYWVGPLLWLIARVAKRLEALERCEGDGREMNIYRRCDGARNAMK
jgi:hypothetical protein